ncbi:MAG: hypothetical protein NTW60_02170 [Candidatus Wolfebacteria bacterium]|nr:hypothetical protein [Candidatus Wolfebacteria bacterium]
MERLGNFSGYEDDKKIKEDQLALDEIGRQIRELEILINKKRLSLRSANPGSIEELAPDIENLSILERRLKDLGRRKTNLEGGTMGAD